MKKMICSLLCVLLLGMQASAAVVDFQVGQNAFQVLDGDAVKEETLEAPPFVNDQWRTMVPVRAISEAFGAEVGWNGDIREVTIRLDGTEIRLYVDNTEAQVNGAAVTLDSAPVIVEGRTFVPLRFVGEALSCNVNYAAASRHIVIDNTKVVMQYGDVSFSFAELQQLYDMFMEVNMAYVADGSATLQELQEFSLEMALETATDFIWVKNAFPAAALSQEELSNLLLSAQSENLTSPLSGLRDVIYEKLYVAGGNSAAAYIETSVNPEEEYRKSYVCAKHILVEDSELADKVYTLAAGGGDFDALIAEYNTDPGMEANPDGYVFTVGEMVPEFEAAAFAAAEGEITTPVKTTYGYHIIKREPLPAFSEMQRAQVINSLINSALQNIPRPAALLDNATLSAMLGIAG